MFKVRRGLLDGTEERYGLMSSSMRGMSSTRRKIRHWQKLFRLKLGRHMFLGLMVLVFMCVLTKFVLLNMLFDQLALDPVIHANLVKHVPSPNKSPVYNYLFYVIFFTPFCCYIFFMNFMIHLIFPSFFF